MTINNSIEIDFIPVGEESKSGDAIALRFGPKLTNVSLCSAAML